MRRYSRQKRKKGKRMRRYILNGTLNTRDLGGYPTGSGEYTKYGKLLRSDGPYELSAADLDMLYSMGITTAIDLRSAGEVSRKPSSFSSDSRFVHHHRHINDKLRELNGEADIPDGYFNMMDQNDNVRDVMRIIAGAPGGVLFHCAAGKDRTGCTAALLLDLAGVALVDIIADYQVTETYILEMWQRIISEFPELPEFYGRSRPEYIEGFMARVYEEYGGARGFLLALGVTEAELDSIMQKLLG